MILAHQFNFSRILKCKVKSKTHPYETVRLTGTFNTSHNPMANCLIPIR